MSGRNHALIQWQRMVDVPVVTPNLHTTLKSVFGYDSFRPLQQEIIEKSLAGEDVFALLPTGGGKSLCFQLPALVREGLTIVVSPLIAGMKDRVDALVAGGVGAACLDSTVGEEKARAVYWRIQSALRRAGAADGGFVFGKTARVENRARGD